MAQPAADGSRYAIPDSVVSQAVGEEAVLLNLESGTYFSLNGVGACIWEELRCGGSVGDAVERITDRYDVPAEQARADVIGLLEEALEHGLLVAR